MSRPRRASPFAIRATCSSASLTGRSPRARTGPVSSTSTAAGARRSSTSISTACSTWSRSTPERRPGSGATSAAARRPGRSRWATGSSCGSRSPGRTMMRSEHGWRSAWETRSRGASWSSAVATSGASWVGPTWASARRRRRTCASPGPMVRFGRGSPSRPTGSGRSTVPRQRRVCGSLDHPTMTGMGARLATIELPDFGMPESTPYLPKAIYEDRIERLRARAAERGYSRLVVYADREHSANLSYLTGFDPRFEEAILVLGPDGDPAILVGNECFGMAAAAPVTLRRHLFQDLSLPSQPRDRSQPLAEILGDEGIGDGTRVGVVGWKTYGVRSMSDAPSYLVDELRALTGDAGAVENATDLLIDPAN